MLRSGWLVGIPMITPFLLLPISSSSASSITPGVELGCKFKPIESSGDGLLVTHPAHTPVARVEWINESDLGFRVYFTIFRAKVWKILIFWVDFWVAGKFQIFFLQRIGFEKISWFLKWVCFTLLNLENFQFFWQFIF
jgi:hypothetical protein